MRCSGKDATGWAGRRGVAIRLVSSLASYSSRVDDLMVGAQPKGLTRWKTLQCPIGLAR